MSLNHPNKLATITILVIIISELLIPPGCITTNKNQGKEVETSEIDVGTNKTTMKEREDPNKQKTTGKTTITIVYDNNPYDPRLRTGWGFSCLIRTKGKTILFDTGGDGAKLLGNMEKLGIDPEKIDIVVLSHIHGDHTGGLSNILAVNNNLTVYTPKSFPKDFKDYIMSNANLFEVSKPTEIVSGVYTTGELGTTIVEQSLVVVTPRGLVVVTGCAHPGVVRIVEKAGKLLNMKVHLVVGGFHLGGARKEEVIDIVEAFRGLGVEKVMPCHCTGTLATKIFAEEYKHGFVECGVGKTFEIA